MSPASRPAPLVAREQTLQELWLQVAASADQGMRAAAVREPSNHRLTVPVERDDLERARQRIRRLHAKARFGRGTGTR